MHRCMDSRLLQVSEWMDEAGIHPLYIDILIQVLSSYMSKFQSLGRIATVSVEDP